MDNTTQNFARKIISELQAIKQLIVDTISHPRQEHSRPETNQSKTKAGEAQADPRLQSPPPKGNPTVASSDNPARQNYERFQSISEWKPVIELATLVFVVAYVTVNIFLWCESKKANIIARDALIASQRPWVGLTDDEQPLQTTPLIIDKKGDANLSYRITAKNFSQFGAQRVFPLATLYITQNTVDIKTWENKACNPSSIGESMGVVLFSGKVNVFAEDQASAPREQWIRDPTEKREEFSAFLVGCVLYADRFKNPYHTGFSYRLSRNGGGAKVTPSPQTVSGEWTVLHSFLY